MTRPEEKQIWNDTYVYPAERHVTVVAVDEEKSIIHCQENTGWKRNFTMPLHGFLKRHERVI